MKHIEMENRLIDFSVNTIIFTDNIKQTFAGSHLSKQLIRSSTSVSLNYGEARGASSTKEFIQHVLNQ